MKKITIKDKTMRGVIRACALLLAALMIMLSLSACSFFNKADEGSDTEYVTDGGGTEADIAAEASGSGPAMVGMYGEGAPGEAKDATDGVPAFPGHHPLPDEGEAFVLTDAEWSDHANWPFFVNLVNSETISFPSFGLDPRNRVRVTVTDASGNPLRGETVELIAGDGSVIWTAKSGKDGTAYLFSSEGDAPAAIVCGGNRIDIETASAPDESGQGTVSASSSDDYTISVDPAAPAVNGVQIMFIVDTTGSMADELMYLQKDFSAIAGEVGDGNVSFSANFYRDEGDEYVTKCNPFTQDVQTVKAQLEAEYAEGGGDTPEAVAEILAETMGSAEWRDDCAKIAFLIFDAPPHDQREESLRSSISEAAEKGIALIPVVASNADRETEIFGRAAAILTGGTYVFLTDDSGIGESHLEPIVGDYNVELLHDIIVRVINDYR